MFNGLSPGVVSAFCAKESVIKLLISNGSIEDVVSFVKKNGFLKTHADFNYNDYLKNNGQ